VFVFISLCLAACQEPAQRVTTSALNRLAAAASAGRATIGFVDEILGF
jgi:hypothetical protein